MGPNFLNSVIQFVVWYCAVYEVTISPEKIIWQREKRALCYIHLRILYVGFTVRVGVRIIR